MINAASKSHDSVVSRAGLSTDKWGQEGLWTGRFGDREVWGQGGLGTGGGIGCVIP